jgi:hypothetical protein
MSETKMIVGLGSKVDACGHIGKVVRVYSRVEDGKRLPMIDVRLDDGRTVPVEGKIVEQTLDKVA